MTDCIDQINLKGFVQGTVAEDQRPDLIEHLVECAGCRERMVVISEMTAAANKSYRDDHPDILKQAMRPDAPVHEDSTGKISDSDVVAVKKMQKSIDKKKSPANDQTGKMDVGTGTAPVALTVEEAEPAMAPRGPRPAIPSKGRRATGRREGGGTGPHKRPVRARKRNNNGPIIIIVVLVVIIAVGGIAFKQMNESSRQSVPASAPSEMDTPAYEADLQKVGGYMGSLATADGAIQVRNHSGTINGNADQKIFEKNEVQVSNGGFVCLSMAKGVLAYIDGNSSVRLGKKKLEDNTDFTIELINGSLFADISSSADFNAYRIKAGNSYIYGGGSEVLVRRKGGSTIVSVAKGNAYVRGANGSETGVGAGKQLTAGAGSPGPIDLNAFAWINVKGVKYALAPEKKAAAASGAAADTFESVSHKDDFNETKLRSWRIHNSGSWLVRQNALNHSSDEKQGLLLLKAPQFRNFTMRAACRSGGEGEFGLVFGYTGKSYTYFAWTASGEYKLVKVSNGSSDTVSSRKGDTPVQGTYYNIEVTVERNVILVEIDGSMVLRGTADIEDGLLGLYTDGDAGAGFDSFAVQNRRLEVLPF